MPNLFHTSGSQRQLLADKNLCDTYREDLKDVDTGEVQFFILAVHRKRHRYVPEVL